MVPLRRPSIKGEGLEMVPLRLPSIKGEGLEMVPLRLPSPQCGRGAGGEGLPLHTRNNNALDEIALSQEEQNHRRKDRCDRSCHEQVEGRTTKWCPELL